MKRNILIGLVLLGFFVPAMGFAAETEVKEVTDKTLAALESGKSSAAAELKKAEAEKEEHSAKKSKPAPVATVSDKEKNEPVPAPVKKEPVKAKAVVSKASHEVSSSKTAPETKEKPTVSTESLNTEEMQKRWKALFSKEIDSESIVYTVKPGDSLYVLAKKNHTTVDFIKKINGLKGDSIYPQMKLKIHTEPFSIEVDKSKNTLSVFSKEKLVKIYSVATGKKNCTPVGKFKITDKLTHPTWFKTGAILPPGSPENALGTRWMGFDKPGYGIHGTIEPKSIGTQASEGCIRMLNEDVEELYSVVPNGTIVTIQD